MKILLLENYPEIKKDYLKYLEKKHEIFELSDDFSNSEIEVLIIRSKIFADKNLLEKYSNTKYICRIGIGMEKIDLKFCKNKGIKVLSNFGANSDSVADLVLAGILNLSRKLHLGFKGLENRFEYMGNEIGGKTIGIIGFGNIGKKIYSRLKGFGVKSFLIYDPFLQKEQIEENIFCKKIETKEEVFSKSDILSFHIPLLESTKNFLGEKDFSKLKKNILIVNTSRGGIIEEKFLIDFLKDNKQAKFFGDVWEEENIGLVPKKELLGLKNCLIYPHIGAMTKEAEEKMHYFEELDG